MDFGRAFGAEFRTVEERTRDGKPAWAVIASRRYATGAQDLWDALTDPERIPRWFLPVTGEFALGGRYQLEGNAGGRITRCDPPEALDVTWEFAGNLSWVSLRLAPQGDETVLTLEHVMLKDEAGEAHWRDYGPGATGVGWDLSFLGLGLHLDGGGAALDRAASDAWLASDPGKAVIASCAEAWGAAHVAAGEAPEVAQAMAARTAAAYTGG